MQILYNIGMILKSLAVAVGKLLFLLLIRLYLIIPVLYVLAIWIASLCVPFDLGHYSTFLIVGITLCVALSALLVLRRAMIAPTHRKQRSTGVQTAGAMETGRREEQPQIAEDTYASAAATQAPPAAAPVAPDPVVPDPAAHRPEPVRPVTVQEEIPREQPRYYRTKRDPSLYIAEYSDRLEYFRRMEDGTYRYLDTEQK